MRMARPPGLDIDLLRTFALIAGEGSFTRAAALVGRTQSAVSLQVQRLEALVGQRVFVRSKGGVVQLTPQGRLLLARAHEMLHLNDDIVQSLNAQPKSAEIRIGVADDFFGLRISERLAEFSRVHQEAAIETIGAPSCALVPLLKAGELDLMICEAGIEPRRWPSVELWRGGLHWITSETHAAHRADPLPLSISPGDCPWRPPWLDECPWRGAALGALERAGRRYRIVSTSVNLADQRIPVLAGSAVMVSTMSGLPTGLRALGPEEGLPPLPEVRAVLLKAQAPRRPVVDLLAEHIATSVRTGAPDERGT